MFGPHDVWALLAFSSNTLVRSVEIVFGFHSDLENSSFNLCAPTEAYWCEEDGQIWTSKVLENELQVGLCYFELVVDLHVSSVLCHMMPLDSHRLCKPRKERNLWKQKLPAVLVWILIKCLANQIWDDLGILRRRIATVYQVLSHRPAVRPIERLQCVCPSFTHHPCTACTLPCSICHARLGNQTSPWLVQLYNWKSL